MILATEAAHAASAQGKVFTIYGIFWVVALAVLFFGIGFLLKKRAKLSQQQHHDAHQGH